ncbi:MAG TPA: hypothetical protein VFO70_03215 [Chitinophagaceae bacterium]|nr:hypothetical protein [Chitinophagaceae bacterium]
MKKTLLATIMIVTTVVLISSCASTRKYGCPMATVKAQSINS